MHPSWLALGLLAASCEPAPAPSKDAAPESKAEAPLEAKAPVEPEPKVDPVLLEVCAAFDEEVAANPNGDQLLMRVAVRAVSKHGLSEAQIAKLGPLPAELLDTIRAQGSPPECKAFEDRLETLPSP